MSKQKCLKCSGLGSRSMFDYPAHPRVRCSACNGTGLIEPRDGKEPVLKTTCTSLDCPERTGGECKHANPKLQDHASDCIESDTACRVGIGCRREPTQAEARDWSAEIDSIAERYGQTPTWKQGLRDELIEFGNRLLARHDEKHIREVLKRAINHLKYQYPAIKEVLGDWDYADWAYHEWVRPHSGLNHGSDLKDGTDARSNPGDPLSE